MDAEDPNAPIDSAGVAFVMGEWLVFVDVLGGLSAEDAMATATGLATQQADCLASPDPCGTVTRVGPNLTDSTGTMAAPA